MLLWLTLSAATECRIYLHCHLRFPGWEVNIGTQFLQASRKSIDLSTTVKYTGKGTHCSNNFEDQIPEYL